MGVGAVFSGIVVVIFSMVGAEIATIAAAESRDPERAIARATNSVVVRIAVFFVGSLFLLATILPWNSTELGASPYVSAFKQMGLPYADHVMNAVVLTAVLSCLNSGLYTASRMLFVLAARREAPVALITVNRRGVPVWAILTSTVVGFLCVDRRRRLARHRLPLPAELLGRRDPLRVPADRPVAAGAAAADAAGAAARADVALSRPHDRGRRRDRGDPRVDVRGPDSRSQILLSLASWAVVLVLYRVTRWRGGSVEPTPAAGAGPELTAPPRRVLVLANETLGARELLDELRRIDGEGKASYFVCVPANPVDTGQAEQNGPVWVWEATVQAARRRLDRTLGDPAGRRSGRRGRAGGLPPGPRARGGRRPRSGPTSWWWRRTPRAARRGCATTTS